MFVCFVLCWFNLFVWVVFFVVDCFCVAFGSVGVVGFCVVWFVWFLFSFFLLYGVCARGLFDCCLMLFCCLLFVFACFVFALLLACFVFAFVARLLVS